MTIGSQTNKLVNCKSQDYLLPALPLGCLGFSNLPLLQLLHGLQDQQQVWLTAVDSCMHLALLQAVLGSTRRCITEGRGKLLPNALLDHSRHLIIAALLLRAAHTGASTHARMGLTTDHKSLCQYCTFLNLRINDWHVCSGPALSPPGCCTLGATFIYAKCCLTSLSMSHCAP